VGNLTFKIEFLLEEKDHDELRGNLCPLFCNLL